MNKLYDISVLNTINGFLDGQLLSIRTFYDPPVVDILEGIAGNLLLVR